MKKIKTFEELYPNKEYEGFKLFGHDNYSDNPDVQKFENEILEKYYMDFQPKVFNIVKKYKDILPIEAVEARLQQLTMYDYPDELFKYEPKGKDKNEDDE